VPRLLPVWSGGAVYRPVESMLPPLGGALQLNAGGLVIARRILASAARAPGVALVGGATLGFAVGRTLVQPIWSRAAPSAWIGFSVAVVLALTLVGAYVAASSTLAASRRPRHPA